jgi:hypothetical protein
MTRYFNIYKNGTYVGKFNCNNPDLINKWINDGKYEYKEVKE